MKLKSIILACMLAASSQGCTPSKTTPELPPMTNAPIMSPEEAAINNTEIIDSEAAAAKQGQ